MRINESEKVQPKNREELKKIIKETIASEGPNCDLNFIDVSKITDMSELFSGSKFNGDISKWDVSNVGDMSGMFTDAGCKYSLKDIEDWKINDALCDYFKSGKYEKDMF